MAELGCAWRAVGKLEAMRPRGKQAMGWQGWRHKGSRGWLPWPSAHCPGVVFVYLVPHVQETTLHACWNGRGLGQAFYFQQFFFLTQFASDGQPRTVMSNLTIRLRIWDRIQHF